MTERNKAKPNQIRITFDSSIENENRSTTQDDWLAKHASLSQPLIRCSTKNNRASLARVFPRFTPVTRICFEF